MNSKSASSPAPQWPPLSKNFEPREFEDTLYRHWEESGFFDSADTNQPGQEAFCMAIPPPNVTGVLHMGHALTDTIEDVLARWHRMKGFNTLWLPGTDHAGIATQAQVEKAIAKEGKGPTGRPLTRHDLGREKFLERTWKWKEDHHHVIVGQLRRMGCSLDWKRERFTMDPGFSNAVTEVFVRLYEERLIYRGARIINWCCRCQTALSDLEVIPTDRKGKLWHIRYEIVEKNGNSVKNESGEPATLVIATTRPETLLGDSALAIHPDDERYAFLRGKFAKLPLLGRIVPIIQDEYVDREFGSGALKVTPAHDFNDNDLGSRHQLEIISVMGRDGKITAEGGPYVGLKFNEAREKVVQDLESQGHLIKVEDHALKQGLCQRCDTIAEPIISEQWFVKIESLAKPAIEAVEKGKIEFSPKNWEKTYFEWMYNIRDWCISRQLWWGHQIPAWHCGDCAAIQVARVAPKNCNQCGKNNLKQDEDVLDTWFSSGLWPFATLGWPEKTAALKTFYPNSVIETGFDILFFWVARMIMMGIHFMGDVPFKKVYLHAMVRDEKGEKMSKSKGNVIDPLVVMDQHGADALRFTFAIMAGQGRDIKLSLDRVEGYRAFGNKIWNATRFMLMQWDAVCLESSVEPAEVEAWGQQLSGAAGMGTRLQMHPINRWILSELQDTILKVETALSQFELNVASQAIYDFIWHEVCDWYIELSKLHLRTSGPVQRETLFTLNYVINDALALLHPFMPFLTERLWHELPCRRRGSVSLMKERFPVFKADWVDPAAVKSVSALKSIVEALRGFRGENRISPKTEFEVQYVAKLPAAEAFLRANRTEILALCRLSALMPAKGDGPGPTEVEIPLSNPPIDLRINIQGLVDVEEESRRLEKDLAGLNSDLEHVRKKLANPAFVDRAPPELVAKEKATERELMDQLNLIKGARERLSLLRKPSMDKQ